MTNDFGESATQLGPSKVWSVGQYKLMHYDHRMWHRWGFQAGSYGSESDSPLKAIYSALRFRRKSQAEIRARHNK